MEVMLGAILTFTFFGLLITAIVTKYIGQKRVNKALKELEEQLNDKSWII